MSESSQQETPAAQPPPPPPQVVYPPPPHQQTDAAPALIPYKNPPALIAYYLGVFSFIPFLGIVLGIPAFVLGILGLCKAAREPHVKGKVHAWVGIIAGGLFAIGYLLLIVLFLMMEFGRRSSRF